MKNIDPQIVINFLNEILSKDPKAIKDLIEYRVVVSNDELLNHPTLQVAVDPNTGVAKVGLLGILNGLVGIHEKSGAGYIAAQYGDDGELATTIDTFVLNPITEDL